jgi:hypothetical protein
MDRRIGVLALSLLVGACAGGETAESSAAVPVYRGVEDVTIGQLDGPPEYTFSQVGGVTRDGLGRIYVADPGVGAVRVFDSAGSFLFTVGREGEGPGEMIRPICPTFGPSGLLWVRDGGNRRYDAFQVAEDSARPVRTVQMVHSDGGRCEPATFGPEGQLIDIGAETGSTGVLTVVRHWIGDDGKVARLEMVPEPTLDEVNTVAINKKVTGGMATYYYPQPFGPQGLAAHGPGGVWATAVSSRFSVDLHVDSSVVNISNPSYTRGPPLSDREKEAGEAQLDEHVKRSGKPRSAFAPVPGRKPVLAGLMFDDSGRLWVELSRPDGDPRRANVYDQSGDLVGQYEWPREVSLHVPAWIGTDRALGISRDTLGVERVVALRFVPLSGGS